jgi:hypothetical protein
MWRLPGWVRDPDRQEARTPPAGDEKPAADAKERGFRVRGPEPRGTPYPVVRQGSPMIQPGLQGNRLRGCTLWWPLGSARPAILLQWNNSPNSASMSAHESCAARSPKSPRRAPDRCPHFADYPHGLGRAPATPSILGGMSKEGSKLGADSLARRRRCVPDSTRPSPRTRGPRSASNHRPGAWITACPFRPLDSRFRGKERSVGFCPAPAMTFGTAHPHQIP